MGYSCFKLKGENSYSLVMVLLEQNILHGRGGIFVGL